jgi:spermidine/putrescine-binding protein
MVIPVTSKNPDLAHEFINFFLDEENGYENASYIGYCPTITSVYQRMLDDEDLAEIVRHPGYYPGNINGEIYRHLGEEVALRMDEILTRAKIK